MVVGGADIFVGDGLLFSDDFRDISVVGAFRSFLVPSAGRLGMLLSGDEEDVTGVCGKVFRRIGIKALRTSSAGESLPLSLGLLGGVLEGLFGRTVVFIGGVVGRTVADFGGITPKSAVGYFTCSAYE